MAKATKDEKNEKKAKAAAGKAADKAEKSKKASEAKAAGAAAIEEPVVVVEPESTRLLRLQADFDNFKKRTIRERNETYRRANEDIMEELLPVMDHMELALDAAAQHDADEAMVEGFRMVSEQLRGALAKFGLTPIDASAAEFDPNVHEAISHLPSTDVAENYVVAMTRRGYKLGDMLLRAAQVVVSSGDPTAEAAPEAALSEDEPNEEPEA
ncbi:MAG: nucleotide exchange factor GrpE [Verrucomicrobia bacterium]|jgi:molecular chaperone GrpE|nr:nucleotide exchange factor GrpE [Verrucomicrobiota bacterium]MBT7066349.1 nucleotide exchange factor GrpE [Verrucomicrobiota bacterium]MBT7702196.1 nucleotide exchange factor GrpE [Verrucomicrobiota bacterium]